jgi:hypothetical protein
VTCGIALIQAVQHHVGERRVVGRRRHVRAERLPATVGGRTRIKQAQTGFGGGVPRNVAVAEDQHVAVGVELRHPRLTSGRGARLMYHGEPQPAQRHIGAFGQSAA